MAVEGNREGHAAITGRSRAAWWSAFGPERMVEDDLIACRSRKEEKLTWWKGQNLAYGVAAGNLC